MERVHISTLVAVALVALLLGAGDPLKPTFAVPSNDGFAGAVTLTPTVTTVEIALNDTAGATLEAGEPSPCGVGGATVWYNWTSPASTGTVTFTTFGSNYDTVVGVYTGNSVGGLTAVPSGCNDNFGGSQSIVAFGFAASTTYRIQVGGISSAGGNLVLNMGTAGVFIVNTTADGFVSNSVLSLHEALAFGSAVFTPPCGHAEAAQIFNCNAAGLGQPDLIQFSPLVFPLLSATPILLNGTLPILGGSEIVDGAGAGVLVRPATAGAFDCFRVVFQFNVVRKLAVAHCSRAFFLDGSGGSFSISNTIGPGNEVYGNSTGILILGTGAYSNVVRGNVIGKAGTAQTNGVSVNNSSQNTIGGVFGQSGNVISNNVTGVGISFDASQNQVTGNLIGTDATGTLDQGNEIGVKIESARRNIIGGPAPGATNVISGNNSAGIFLTGTAAQNHVEGNLIGSNAAGTAAIGQADGVEILSSASSNVIGGSAPGQRNVISGNTNGLRLASTGGATAVYQSSPNQTILANSQSSTTIEVPEEATILDVNVTINITHPDVQDLSILLSGGTGNDQSDLSSGNGGSGDNYTNTTFDDSAATLIVFGSAPFTGSYKPEIPLSAFNNDRTTGTWSLVVNNAGPDVGTINSWSIAITTEGNDVKGNYIGTNQAGTSAIANSTGVLIEDSLNTISGNVISGGGAGLFMMGGNNRVFTNQIGLNAAGTAAVPNTAEGIVLGGSSNNLIEGNTISGNWGIGVHLQQSSDNFFDNNMIGLNPAGTEVLGNGSTGVRILEGDSNTLFNNRISGNSGGGVEITNSNSNSVTFNRIGTEADGISPAGNNGHGISVGGTGNVIWDQNVIAYNNGDGVSVTGSGAEITKNRIHSNAGQGIDLGDNDVTANDGAGDPDAGANGLQNFPLLNSVIFDGPDTGIAGTLTSVANQSYRIEFFHSNSCDSSGNGEGELFLGEFAVAIGGAPGATTAFQAGFPGHLAAGRVVTATATRLSTGDTSEFSTCIAAVDDADDDNDGYTDVAEAGAPLCAGGIDDDSDGTVNDGCQGGPTQVGPFSEAQFRIGTGAMDPCGLNGWPSDLQDAPPSANKLDISDIVSFIAPARRLDKNPGQAGFDSRWDLVPGKGALTNLLNIQDITALLVVGSTGYPPMFAGGRAFGQTCPFPP